MIYPENRNMKQLAALAAVSALLAGLPPRPAAGAAAPERNVILVGWDGAQRARTLEMLEAGELPNLKKLAAEGSLALTEVTTGRTETKPGWAEILTGHRADFLKILDNRDYRPIPAGYTVFERLKAAYGGGIAAVFISGKINNLGVRGPHEICLNCISRDAASRGKTRWWDRKKLRSSETRDGKPQVWVAREGEPYFNCLKSLDLYAAALGPADKVGAKALAALKKYRGRPFFIFVHFEEPDEEGHLYGENSAQYAEGLKAADRWLGRLMDRLRSLGLYERTTLFVTTDHGMDEGSNEHFNSPQTFIAVNSGLRLSDGDRKDVALTILDGYGIDLSTAIPPLAGKSLVVRPGK